MKRETRKRLRIIQACWLAAIRFQGFINCSVHWLQKPKLNNHEIALIYTMRMTLMNRPRTFSSPCKNWFVSCICIWTNIPYLKNYFCCEFLLFAKKKAKLIDPLGSVTVWCVNKNEFRCRVKIPVNADIFLDHLMKTTNWTATFLAICNSSNSNSSSLMYEPIRINLPATNYTFIHHSTNDVDVEQNPLFIAIECE